MKILKLIAVFIAVLSMTLSIPAVVHAAPASPGITYPANGELLTVYGPGTFGIYWTATAPTGGYYDVEISTDATFLNTAAIVSSSDSAHAPGDGCSLTTNDFIPSYAFQPATSYYVRIQAYDTTCNHDYVTGGSGWADYVFYTSLAAPTLLAPINGSSLLNNLTNDDSHVPPELFQWSSVAGATGYILEVSTSTAFSSLYINTTIPAGQTYYTPTSDLPVDTTFYWQVEALGASPYSPSGWGFCGTGNCSFTTALAAAPAPAPLQIQAGRGPNPKVTTDTTPGILWNEIALPGGTAFDTYEVQVSTDKTFLETSALCFDVTSSQVGYLSNQNDPINMGLTTAQLDTGVALASAPPPGTNCPTNASHTKFMPDTTYYWRVRAETVGSGPTYYWSDWSSVLAFTISYPKADPTTFTTTGDPISQTITFNWAPVPGAYSYALLGCLDSAPGTCPLNVTKISPPYVWNMSKRNKPAASGVLIDWRVRAQGPSGPGLWSDFDPPFSQVITP
ncbi:MAG: hypothetical protein WCA79_00585 [Anaerolineales bacterium]